MPAKSSTSTNKDLTKPKSASKKQPLPAPEQTRRLFASLCAQIDGAHFKNAVKTCDKILRLDPGDKDAAQTKLFLLLQTEQYTLALDLVDSGDQHEFEKAYTLYRLQRETEASKMLVSIKERGVESRGAVHLEAQLNYRRGNFQAAFDIYDQLLDTVNPDSEEHSDILINLRASQKHLEFINSGFIQSLDTLPVSIRTSLETAPPPHHSSSAITAHSRSGAQIEENVIVNPVKKVRMSRVPAGVTPGVTPPPDPERWLKKSERTLITQGSRKRKGGTGATQGSALTESNSSPSVQGSKGSGGKSKKKR